MTTKKELIAIKKDILAIGKKLEKLIMAVEKSDKPMSTKASKAKAVKTQPAKKPPKTPVKKKVRNILQRTFKPGKIKRAGKGIYIGAL